MPDSCRRLNGGPAATCRHIAFAIALLLSHGASLASGPPPGELGGDLVFAEGFEGGSYCGIWSDVLNPERCNGEDDDCDGPVDDGDPLDCFDSDACTADSCDEAIGSCSFDPYDSDSDPQHCGASCLPCPLPTPEQVHVVATCFAGGCGLACAAGHWDVDENLANGCEVACETDPATTPDVPDDSFLDQNCDGIDGTAADGIFVATYGSNSDPGTREEPVATISFGIGQAQSLGKTFLYVAAGSYTGPISVVAGVGIHGGYSGDQAWQRGPAFAAAVSGPPSGALLASAISATTVVEYLSIESQDAVTPGASSHAMVVTNSAGFRPRHLTILAGDGKPGGAGSPEGQTGTIGGDGTEGADAFEDDPNVFCEAQTDPPLAYAGGTACTGASNKGGDGRRGCITNDSNCAGTGGQAGSGTGGGAAGVANSGSAGGNGGPGGLGTPGADGAGGAGGTISSSQWVPNAGGTGGLGAAGGGGGGGAGGGSTHSSGTCNDWGGGGGGGGGGGCGGSGGGGGQGGGASIGILVIGGSLVAHNLDVTAGNGGSGGAGRDGGSGGVGGVGKSGGDAWDEGRAGGDGGGGGKGGRGGHGGGGAGGWSVCVYRFDGGTYSDSGGGILTPGTGGSGGASSGNPGDAGSAVGLH